jgi:hypothetical protein
MPRMWKRKAVVEKGEVVTIKKLLKVGNSHALVIPKDWLRFFTKPDSKGDIWVRIKYDGSSTILILGGPQ